MIPQFQEAARKSFCYENFSKGLMAVAFGLAKRYCWRIPSASWWIGAMRMWVRLTQ